MKESWVKAWEKHSITFEGMVKIVDDDIEARK